MKKKITSKLKLTKITVASLSKAPQEKGKDRSLPTTQFISLRRNFLGMLIAGYPMAKVCFS